MSTPVVCQLCNFSPETGGTFVDAVVSLAKFAHVTLQIQTYCIFPDAARDRTWLAKLANEGIAFGFVPRKRNVVSAVRQQLSGYEPLIFHCHFSMYDVTAAVLNLLFYKRSKLLWHYHSPTPSNF